MESNMAAASSSSSSTSSTSSSTSTSPGDSKAEVATDDVKSKGPQVTFLEYGAVLVKSFLSVEQQMEMLQLSFQMCDPTTVKPNNGVIYTPMFGWNWPDNRLGDYVQPEIEKTKPTLFDPVLNMAKEAHRLIVQEYERQNIQPQSNPRLQIPADFAPSSLRAILYPKDGRLHAHQDMMMGWVLSASVGQSCTFFWGPKWQIDDDDMRFVDLDSGDFLFLNGQSLVHGVLNLIDGKVPSLWSELQANGTVPETWMRYNLQIRDRSKIV